MTKNKECCEKCEKTIDVGNGLRTGCINTSCPCHSLEKSPLVLEIDVHDEVVGKDLGPGQKQ